MTWAVERFAIPLRHPGTLGAGIVERAGFLVEVRDSDGLVGRGESSPAYWVDRSDLDLLARELDEFVTTRGAGCLPGEAGIDEMLAVLSPAARCGIETALLDLEARQRGCAVAELLGAALPVSLEVGALVGGDDPGDVREQATALLRRGHRVLKLKVGGRSAARDVARVHALREAAGGGATIRLDANRAWDLATASEVLEAVAGPDLELVEEPLAGSPPLELARLRRATGV
ncbi:MAG: mandelate racemase/muconate lactonizing enzyme family protein, partial [Alphaproteobacteria bacterium]